jgi:hypothetical protein
VHIGKKQKKASVKWTLAIINLKSGKDATAASNNNLHDGIKKLLKTCAGPSL